MVRTQGSGLSVSGATQHLKIIRDGLNGDAYFIDTIYGPYMTAMILFQSQPQFASQGKSEEIKDGQIRSLHEFQKENPDGWHNALEAITQSTLNHIQHIRKSELPELSSVFSTRKPSSALLQTMSDILVPMTSGSSTHWLTQS